MSVSPPTRSSVKTTALLALAGAIAMCPFGCGGKGHGIAAKQTAGHGQGLAFTSPLSKEPGRDADNDRDARGVTGYDQDDAEIITYGNRVSGSERQQIATVAKRYLSVAVRGDGGSACVIMYGLFAEQIVEEDGDKPAAIFRPMTECPRVMSGLFRYYGEQFAFYVHTHVTDVRRDGPRGYALLGYGRRTLGSLLVHLDTDHEWKIEAVAVNGLP